MKSFILLIMLFCASVQAQIINHIFSPDDWQPSDLSATELPFLELNNQEASLRYQQVYQNTDFLPFAPGPVRINELIFSTGAGANNVTLPSVQIDLSTTSKQPDGLSTTFSQNVSVDD